MKNNSMETGHLAKEILLALNAGTLQEAEQLQAITHLSECEKCSMYYLNIFTDDELLKAPEGFSENTVLRQKERSSKERQFVFYSFKVAVAACITLAILFSGALDFITRINIETNKIQVSDIKIVNTINSNLKGFSEKILNMEVFKK